MVISAVPTLLPVMYSEAVRLFQPSPQSGLATDVSSHHHETVPLFADYTVAVAGRKFEIDALEQGLGAEIEAEIGYCYHLVLPFFAINICGQTHSPAV